MLSLDKRLRALEARMVSDALTLYFADGSAREICWPGNSLMSLYIAACRGTEITPEQAGRLDMIRQSTHAQFGDSRLGELLRLAVIGPSEEEFEIDEATSPDRSNQSLRPR
jgi:hypothetical protein